METEVSETPQSFKCSLCGFSVEGVIFELFEHLEEKHGMEDAEEEELEKCCIPIGSKQDEVSARKIAWLTQRSLMKVLKSSWRLVERLKTRMLMMVQRWTTSQAQTRRWLARRRGRLVKMNKTLRSMVRRLMILSRRLMTLRSRRLINRRRRASALKRTRRSRMSSQRMTRLGKITWMMKMWKTNKMENLHIRHHLRCLPQWPLVLSQP